MKQRDKRHQVRPYICLERVCSAPHQSRPEELHKAQRNVGCHAVEGPDSQQQLCAQGIWSTEHANLETKKQASQEYLQHVDDSQGVSSGSQGIAHAL